jgi:hypothetical protein
MGICRIRNCSRQSSARGLCNKHYLRMRQAGTLAIGKYSKRGAQRKWLEEHSTHSGDDCLIWPFDVRDKFGYGRTNGTTASRAMCSLAHGPAPTNKHEAAHTCGQGHLGCVNPKHLHWATHKDNYKDREHYGYQYGSQKGVAKV